MENIIFLSLKTTDNDPLKIIEDTKKHTTELLVYYDCGWAATSIDAKALYDELREYFEHKEV